jgi:hypothetical protein
MSEIAWRWTLQPTWALEATDMMLTGFVEGEERYLMEQTGGGYDSWEKYCPGEWSVFTMDADWVVEGLKTRAEAAKVAIDHLTRYWEEVDA